MQLSPLEIKERLLKALDKEYNVVDMAAVVEIISILERTPITKEALESTRLGKFINELRRRTTNESLAKRAKDLVRRWRNLISKPSADAHATNGSRYVPLTSPSVRPPGGVNPLSPHLSSTLTSPALSSRNRTSVLSPPISVHSDRSSDNQSSVRNLAAIKNNAFRSGDQAASVGLHAADSVPKTHASNKRLRKDLDVGDRPAKAARLNGVACKSAADAECSRDSFSDHSESVVEIPIVEEEVKVPKKRGRKKGSTKEAINAARNLAKSEDIVRNRIASIARTPKVKTTQELLAGLQARSSGKPEIVTAPTETQPSLPNSVFTPRGTALDALEISRNKNEHIAKFLRSQSELETIDLDPHYSEGRPSPAEPDLRSVSRLDEPLSNASAEEILSRLPPLPPADEIRWSDSESDAERSEVGVERLHSERLPGVNGAYGDGERRDVEDDGFREWHECMSKQSYQGDLLHILPYAVID